MKSLNHFSNEQLENSLKKLVGQERVLLHWIIEHIKEVSRREIHLQKGFPTLKKYLIQEFGYSESAASRRLEAAKLLAEIPGLAEKIKDGSVNLSVIGEISRAIKEKESVSAEKVSSEVKIALIENVSGKSVWETQQRLAQDLDIEIKQHEVRRVQQDGSVRYEGTFSAELNLKLNQCRDLFAQDLQQKRRGQTTAEVIEMIADVAIESKLRLSQRDMRKIKSNKVSNANLTSGDFDSLECNLAPAQHRNSVSNVDDKTNGILAVKRGNKSVTPRTRKLILLRDKCCQFTDPSTGRRCSSTFALQVDHRQARWAEGDHEVENLQMLCANHNRFKYRQEAGLRFL